MMLVLAAGSVNACFSPPLARCAGFFGDGMACFAGYASKTRHTITLFARRRRALTENLQALVLARKQLNKTRRQMV